MINKFKIQTFVITVTVTLEVEDRFIVLLMGS